MQRDLQEKCDHVSSSRPHVLVAWSAAVQVIHKLCSGRWITCCEFSRWTPHALVHPSDTAALHIAECCAMLEWRWSNSCIVHQQWSTHVSVHPGSDTGVTGNTAVWHTVYSKDPRDNYLETSTQLKETLRTNILCTKQVWYRGTLFKELWLVYIYR